MLVTTPGESVEARYVDESTLKTITRLRQSFKLGLNDDVYQDLQAVASACGDVGWDGFSAQPVIAETAQKAMGFLQALPLESPSPSVGAEPDGHVTLEWYKSTRQTLSVSVSPDGELHFAALMGSNWQFGTETFLGEIPRSILALIRRVTDYV